MQKVLIFEKKKLFTRWIRTRNLLNASQLLYPLSHIAVGFNGMLLGFSTSLSSTRCRTQSDHLLAVTNFK